MIVPIIVKAIKIPWTRIRYLKLYRYLMKIAKSTMRIHKIDRIIAWVRAKPDSPPPLVEFEADALSNLIGKLM